MPRLKKTEAQRRAERVRELYRIGKAKTGLTDEQCASMVGVCRKTLFSAKKNPDKYISLGQMACLGKAFGWTGEEIASIVFPQK